MESQKMYELTLMTSSASLEVVLRTKKIALAAQFLDNLDGSLSNFATLTYKSMQIFNILRTLIEYLEVLTSDKTPE